MANNSTTKRVDALAQLTSSFITTATLETIKRLVDLGVPFVKENQSPGTRANFAELVRKISSDIVSECDFDIDETPTDDAESTEPADESPELELTPVQQLKFDLHDWYTTFMKQVRAEVVADIKDSIKTELRMELFMELKTLTSAVSPAAAAPAAAPSGMSPGCAGVINAGSMTPLSTELGTEMRKKKPVSVNTAKIGERQETFAQKGPSDADVEEMLKNNPLFARVSTNVDRASKGKAMYTVDEMLDIKKNRFDPDSKEIAAMKEREKSEKKLVDEFGDDEDTYDPHQDAFEKALREKLSQLN